MLLLGGGENSASPAGQRLAAIMGAYSQVHGRLFMNTRPYSLLTETFASPAGQRLAAIMGAQSQVCVGRSS